MLPPRTNHTIRSKEVRVIGPAGENFGVLSIEDALRKASEFDLDLIEISPNANPPVTKIADLGKYMYTEQKKEKEGKKKAHSVEVKSVQIKLGTGDHDLSLKAKKATEWLNEGNRVQISLFLPGRAKYLDVNFLKERIERFLKLVTVPHKVADAPKKSPKGMTAIIERA
ncbi:MAG: translation initiation factor IF-3 [Minisyncoccota bacterium]